MVSTVNRHLFDLRLQRSKKRTTSFFSLLQVCDPWSVHLAPTDLAAGKLIQLFMYFRTEPNDNHYAHPLDFTPIVDLYQKKVSRMCLASMRAMPSTLECMPFDAYLVVCTVTSKLSCKKREFMMVPCAPPDSGERDQRHARQWVMSLLRQLTQQHQIRVSHQQHG